VFIKRQTDCAVNSSLAAGEGGYILHLIYGQNHWRTLSQGEENCYLLANGLGGFSSLSVNGACARNDHALLMAALGAPVDRYHLVTNIHEKIIRHGCSDNLASQRFVNHTKNLDGGKYLQCFDFEYLPRWQYKAADTAVTKTVFMKYGENSVTVVYDICSASEGILELTPWFQFVPKGRKLLKNQKFVVDTEKIVSGGISLYYRTNGMAQKTEPDYVDDWYYALDAVDGREAFGAAVSCQKILCHFRPGRQTFYVCYSTARPEDGGAACSATKRRETKSGVSENGGTADVRRIYEAMAEEEARLRRLEDTAGLKDPVARMLVRSASQYMTWRDSTASMSMIAGYPFFGDWGRDTMIAMQGCAVAVKQFEAARSILRTFMAYLRRGLMPNMFPEGNGEPLYNTVDASLLFFEVVYQYYIETNDTAFVAEALPAMADIIRWYKDGTDYGIFMDSDGLICAGEGLWQLTWMDVRVDDILPTPRHGKPVEINAYWYNALMIMAELSGIMADGRDSAPAAVYRQMAQQTKKSFLAAFWDDRRGYLLDVVSGTAADRQIRCNQIWALTLSFVMPDKAQAGKILDTVFEHLYTPWGLRSLSPADAQFHGYYGGTVKERDMAYHQGTVWAYPLGAYYMARLRFADDKAAAVRDVRRQLLPVEAALREGCAGHLAEIYDGGRPDTSRGCFAQAWSVGEILRVYKMLEEMEGQMNEPE